MSVATDTATASAETSAPTRVGVVLVDARPERRAVLRTLIEHSDVAAAVLGEADGEAEALAAVEQHAAELLIIDFQAPVQDGLDAVAALRARFPGLVIIVCSFNDDATVRRCALAQGADAYLLKPVTARDLMSTMRGLPPRTSSMQSATAAR